MIYSIANHGKHLYHFTKTEKALLYILPNKRLKLNSILESNDPKENKTFGFWSILSKIKDFDYQTIEQAFKDYLMKSCKQICFSLDYCYKDMKHSGYNHPTMWANYADNSKGVCLVFDKELFIKENENLIKGGINYTSLLNFPSLDGDLWKKEKDNYFEKFVKENSKELFYNKYYHWGNEDEYKFIGINQPEYCSIENSLFGLYLGLDFDPELECLALSLMKLYNKEVNKIKIDDGRYYCTDVHG